MRENIHLENKAKTSFIQKYLLKYCPFMLAVVTRGGDGKGGGGGGGGAFIISAPLWGRGLHRGTRHFIKSRSVQRVNN